MCRSPSGVTCSRLKPLWSAIWPRAARVRSAAGAHALPWHPQSSIAPPSLLCPPRAKVLACARQRQHDQLERRDQPEHRDQPKQPPPPARLAHVTAPQAAGR